MTALVDPATAVPPAVGLLYRPAAVTAVAGGCLLLVARPLLLGATAHPQPALALLFVALLVVGWAWPLAANPNPDRSGDPQGRMATLRVPRTRGDVRWIVLGVGVAAFAVGRVLGGGEAPSPAVLPLVALGSLAAVAEEAFFRRLTYAALLPGGAFLAVMGSAVLFAVVHVTVYGAWVLPLDLAAGLVLSWQRWATGAWGVPAVTHVVANLLVVL